MNTVIQPRSFDASEFLTVPRLQMHADDARWLVSTILKKTANRDIDTWGLVRLDARVLRRVMNQETAREIVEALERGGAIETAPYCPGVKCKGYRLAKRYLGDRCVRVPILDPRLLDRIERERERLQAEERQTCWKPIHYRLDAEQQHLTIDAAADAILDGLPDHTRLCQDVLVDNLRRRSLPFSVGKTGRVFNSITGLKRELRQALRLGGEQIGAVDISCAQPGLLAMAMSQFYPPSVGKTPLTYKHSCSPLSRSLPSPPSLASDVPSFVSLASEGSLYERLAELSGLPRAVVKRRFLVDVLAKKGKYPSEVEQVFRAEFPTVFQFIRGVNADDHSELIRLLQQMESWLIIDQVSPRLIDRTSVVTLHDAIYASRHDLPTVEDVFEDTFARLGFRLSLKRE